MTSLNSNAGISDLNNSSVIPILMGETFNGQYSSVLNFAEILVDIKCDSNYELKIIFSSDATNDNYDEVINSDKTNLTKFYTFKPKMRYFRIQLKNTEFNDQTFMNMNTVLKSTLTYIDVDLSGVTNVNIMSPLTDGSVSVKGVVLVENNTYSTNKGLMTVSNIDQLNGKKVFNNQICNINDISLPIILNNICCSNLTLFGKCDKACKIVIEFSDSDSNEYYASQYSFSLSQAGSFGASIAGFCAPCCHLKILEGNDVTINAFMYVS